MDDDCPDMPPTLLQIAEIQNDNARLREAMDGVKNWIGYGCPGDAVRAFSAALKGESDE